MIACSNILSSFFLANVRWLLYSIVDVVHTICNELLFVFLIVSGALLSFSTFLSCLKAYYCA